MARSSAHEQANVHGMVRAWVPFAKWGSVLVLLASLWHLLHICMTLLVDAMSSYARLQAGPYPSFPMVTEAMVSVVDGKWSLELAIVVYCCILATCLWGGTRERKGNSLSATSVVAVATSISVIVLLLAMACVCAGFISHMPVTGVDCGEYIIY